MKPSLSARPSCHDISASTTEAVKIAYHVVHDEALAMFMPHTGTDLFEAHTLASRSGRSWLPSWCFAHAQITVVIDCEAKVII